MQTSEEIVCTKSPLLLQRSVFVAGAIVTCLITFLYLLLFWNHFAGLRSGMGEFGGGTAFLAGLRPYRDYFTASTPLNILKSATELSIFGNAAIVTRACAVFERVLLAALVFFWLGRFFRPHHAALGAIVTVLVSTGDLADPLASYNHDAMLFAIASGFLASYTLDDGRSARYTVLLAISSGMCAGLSLATKQTIGLGATIAIPIVATACLLRVESLRKSAAFLGGFCLGWAFAASLLLLWLAQLGILHAFFSQVFVQGPAAKASHPSDFFFRELLLMKQQKWAALAGAALVVFAWPLVRSSARKVGKRAGLLPPIVSVLLLGSACVLAGALASYAGVSHVTHSFLKVTIYFTFLSVALLSLFFGTRWLLGRLTRRESQFCLFAAVSFTTAFMLSLSYPIFEAMTLPGLGLLVSALLDQSSSWRTVALYAACGVLITGETCAKLDIPFGFAGFNEPPVRTANVVSSFPQLRGFVLPRETVDFVDGTLRIIQENSTPQDTIFTYPELAFFYALAARQCPTFTYSHNMDVVNDEFARREAARLLSKRPAVLIYYVQSEWDLRRDELLWRNGRRSGNRDISAAVETLAKQYRLAKTIVLPASGYRVMVYVRPLGERAATENSSAARTQ